MSKDNNKQKEVYLLGAGAVVVLLLITVVLLSSLKKQQNPPPSTENYPLSLPQEQEKEVAAPPTISEEQIEIAKTLEDHKVEISNGKFNPSTLEIKLHDQVTWSNKDGKAHKISGEEWGGVKIENGENFTQVFDKAGTYNYSCSLHPEMTGKIIVR